MSSISVGIITVGLSTISDRSENDRLRGTHYLDRPMSKWKYCMRMSAHFFPLSWPERCFFFFNQTNLLFFLLSSPSDWMCVHVNRREMQGHTRKAANVYININFLFWYIHRPLASFAPFKSVLWIIRSRSLPVDNISSSNGSLWETFFLLVWACASHSSGSGADGWCRPEKGTLREKSKAT